MSMIVQCPNCFSRVCPSSAGTCPSCRQYLNDEDIADDGLCQVVIRELEPEVTACISCSRATEKTRRCTFARESQSDVPGHAAASIAVFLVSLLAGWFVFLRKKDTIQSFVLAVPQCDDCHRAFGQPKSVSVDFDAKCAKFDACGRFVKSLRKARGEGVAPR